MQSKKKKDYVLFLLSDLVLMLYCVCFLREWKWKLLLLPQGVLILVRIAADWLEDSGKTNQASVIRKIYRIASTIFLVVLIVVLLGCLFGVWNL